MKPILCTLILLAASARAGDHFLHTFQKLQLSPQFWSEGAHVGDFDHDGKLDVVSGPFWYAGPDFKTRHEIRPATQTFQKTGADGSEQVIPGFEGALGAKNSYSDSFFSFVHDFNADGWADVLAWGLPGQQASWYENPQGKPGHWKAHAVFPQVDNESPTLADLTGDGRPELVCNHGGNFGYASPDPADPTKPWTFHPITRLGKWGRFTHGLGVGDVTGDGRADLIEAGGVWEQPASLDGDPVWKKHPAPFGTGAQFHAYDVNADGLIDVIGSLAAHGYGLAWWEQVREGGTLTFRKHLIMGDKPELNPYGLVFSQLHSIDLADIDGDGLKDIVTGKRFWAHGPAGDPEPNAPAVLYWFQLTRQGKEVKFVPHRIDDDSGVGTQVLVTDVNGDTLPEVVVGNKKGTFVHLHGKKAVSEAEWRQAQPKVSASPQDRERQLRLVRETEALTPEQQQAKMRVPGGFRIELFASEPMINKPINLAFDERGRLWVSSNTEYPYAAKKERWADPQGSRVKDSRDAIKILEDTDGDGRADKVTDFADGLNVPTGVLPWHKPEHKAGCIAWSIPNLWYFADTDGDGKCDLREVLFGPLGYERDTHGMCSSFRLGADGWVYATHGFNNTSHFKARDGSTLDLHSGNVFRFRPDGSRVEPWSWGQTNPFGLCWDRRGNLYSADCHSNPITQLLPGASYPSYRQSQDPLGFAPVMCQHGHGSTGLCGVAYVDGGIWGPEWDDHIFLGNCVNSRVNADQVIFTGTTPRAHEKPDFVTCEDPWFRPVDLQIGPDNALYIADFYNRIIGHYEVPLDHPGRDRERGRIWRVVKEGASKTPRPAPPAPVRHTIADLRSPDPFVKRAAAASLARTPDPAATPLLLAALPSTDPADAQLQHQLRIALRAHLALDGAFTALSKPADIATALSIATAVPTAEAAAFVSERWDESPAPLADRLTHLARYGDPALIESAIAEQRASSTGSPAEAVAAIAALHQGILERGLKTPASLLAWATERTESLLAASGRSDSAWQETPHPGSAPGASPWCLDQRKNADGAPVAVLSSLDRSRGGGEKLTGILRSRAFPAPAKVSFWLCGHRGAPGTSAHEKNLVRLVADGRAVRQAFPPRNDTAQRIEWDLADLRGQTVTLEIVDGDEGGAYAWLGAGGFSAGVPHTDDFRPEGARTGQLQTLAMLLRTTAPVSLRDRLAPYLPKATAPMQAAPQPEIDALIKSRTAAYASAKPDPALGETAFKTHCAACHQVKGQGGLIGPQLDGVGSRGPDRLMEDILDPNRNVDLHFRLHTLKLHDGSALTGFVRGEVGQVIVLVDAAGNEQRIAKGDIAKDTELAQSLMPPAFGQLIEPATFNHLVGWLAKQ